MTTTTKKLIHRAFRIPEDVLEDLQTRADYRGVSLSNLVNKILRDYLAAERQPEKSDFILMNKDFFRRIFNMIDDGDIDTFGREIGYAVVNKYTSTFFSELNSCTIVLFLES